MRVDAWFVTGPDGSVHLLLQTNDLVLLSFVRALLSEAGIEFIVLDAHMSVLEGSLGVLPRRLLVPDHAVGRARRALAEAGVRAELSDDA